MAAYLLPNPLVLEETCVLTNRRKELNEYFGITPRQAEIYITLGFQAQLHKGRVYLEWAKTTQGRVTSSQAFSRFQTRLNLTAEALAADEDYQRLIRT